MVRKSERTKAKGTPEKMPEKLPRKSGRYSRRRRKSSSESDRDVSTVEVRESGDEVQETPEESSVKSPERKPEVVESVSGGGRSKRITRKQAAENEMALSTEKEKEKEKEWKEDEKFWSSEGDAPVGTSEAKPKEDEGSLWKVQSSNGSSGEIQKLKICRQRTADASESSPSSAKGSPRRKRSSRLTPEEPESESEPIPSSLETEAPSNTAPDQTEPVPADITDMQEIKPIESSAETQEKVQEIVNIEEPEKENLPSQCDNQPAVLADEEDSGEKKMSEDAPNSIEDKERENEKISRSSSEKETPDSSTRRKRSGSSSSNEASQDSDSTSEVERKQEIKENRSDSTPEDETREEKITNRKRTFSHSSSDGGDTKPNPQAEPPLIKEELHDKEEIKSEIMSSNEEELNTAMIESIEGSIKRECEEKDEHKETELLEKIDPEEDSKTEDSVKPPAAKKLRERIKFPDDTTESKSEIPEIKDMEMDSIKEEGELSPARKETRSHPRILVINKPQEHHSTKPTILKRTIEENPPVQRKRRLTGDKRIKPSDESTLTISSQSLKLLVPDAKPLPPEEVDLTYEGGREEAEEGGKEEEGEEEEEEVVLEEGEGGGEEEEGIIRETEEENAEQSEESKARKIEIKARDMEIRVQNDVREVTKKEPPRIEKKEKPKEQATDKGTGQTIMDKIPRKEKLSVKVSANDSKFTRKISIVSDDAKKLTRSPSPPGRKPTAVLFITNLVRPFTAPQLRELLARTGTIAPNGFYIDKIKSKCYVKYTEVDMAVETRHALHGVRWPVNNPKTLKVEFATAEDMAVVQQLAEDENKKPDSVDSGWLNEQAALKPSRRVTAGVREWDVGKVKAHEIVLPPVREEHPERKREEDWMGRNKEKVGEAENRRRERPYSPEHKEYPARKTKRRDNDAPSKLLDDLFRKTKTTPCIYWLPLTASQIVVKEEMRRQHMAEHERRLAEIRKSEQSRRDRERERRKK